MATKLYLQAINEGNLRLGILIFGLMQLSSCSAKPENSPSGACTLSCGNARVAAAEFTVKRMNTSPIAIKCTVGQPLSAPLTIRYRVSQTTGDNFKGTVANANANAGAAGGQAVPTPVGGDVSDIPVASVGFDPVVYGDMAFSKTAGEFKNSNNEVNPVRYAGVVTPPGEWCSDSCGVMTFEVWPNCLESAEVKAAVQVGGVTLDNKEWTTITLKE